MKRWLLVATCAALGACGGERVAEPGGESPQSATAASEVVLNQEFELRPGQTVRLRGGGLSVTFPGVAEDSRCPVDVQCVWAGNARVALRAARPGGSMVALDLNTTLEPRAAEAFGHTLRLVGLAPAPTQGTPIRPQDYRARLVIGK